MTQIVSEKVLKRIRERASMSPRPKQRLSTIDRVVEACNAIETGDAAKLIKSVFGKDYNLRNNPKISPSNIAHYVDARKKRGGADWTGPKRPTIQSDPDLKTYVDAREAEREKPVGKVGKTSLREEIASIVDRIPDLADRSLLREYLASLSQAKRESDALTKLLKEIAPLEYEKLRAGDLSRSEVKKVKSISVGGSLSETDVACLGRLSIRLRDSEALAKVGLEISKERVRHKRTKHPIIERDELECLLRLSGYAEEAKLD